MATTGADKDARSDSTDEDKNIGEVRGKMADVNGRDSVSKKVKGIIISQLSLEDEQVRDTASFVDDLDVDSLDIVELVMAIEEEFELEIPDEEVEEIKTVGDMISHIKKKTQK